jgi:hypothetical protein
MAVHPSKPAPQMAGFFVPLQLAQPTRTGINLETGMERDEDGVVLGFTRLPGSQRLHQ